MGDRHQLPPHGEPVREWSSLKDILYGSVRNHRPLYLFERRLTSSTLTGCRYALWGAQMRPEN